MKLDYITLLNPHPIKLSIGTLRKPTLQEIYDEITFLHYDRFLSFLKLTPEVYFKSIEESGQQVTVTHENTKVTTRLFDLILQDENLRGVYTEILNFFFVEKVIFFKDLFLLIHNDADEEHLKQDDVVGAIHEGLFDEVLAVIQQVCCIYNEEENIENIKFHNKKARKMFLRFQKAAQQKRAEADINMSLPNIISAVSNCHPTLSPTSVWNLTIFQLYDSFKRLQVNKVYEIDSTRVSVWGDEKKTFDITMWYKNHFDKKS